MIAVDAFSDEKREFTKKWIQEINVNALDPDFVIMYGPAGGFRCHKVFMVGYWFWASEESYQILVGKLSEAKQGLS